MTLQGLNFTNLLTKTLKKTEKIRESGGSLKNKPYLCGVKFKVQPVFARVVEINNGVLGIGDDPRPQSTLSRTALHFFNVKFKVYGKIN